MANALLGLGSNESDRERNLRSALDAIKSLPDVLIRRVSEFRSTKPLGGPAGQGEFLNAAAVVQTKTPPARLLDELKDIEARLGRKPGPRWAARPIDIDLLLYDNDVLETATLTLPHPRMSFRRFVLEPAVEIAPRMLHPVIGWPLERLLLHLSAASDRLAIVTPSDQYREHFAKTIADNFKAALCYPPLFHNAELLWPPQDTCWLQFDSAVRAPAANTGQQPTLPYAAEAFPKLTILLDAESTQPNVAKSQWSAVVRRPGRGPTLRMQAVEAANFHDEVLAATQAVWPDLGPANPIRLQ